MISLTSLQEKHFPLLLKWLEAPHVKAWWDQSVHWTLSLIQEKFGSYVKGYSLEEGIRKRIFSYIIKDEHFPIGYIQIYNAYDYLRAKPLLDLPSKLAAFDIFIGEQEYVGKGIGAQVLLKIFDGRFLPEYDFAFADPSDSNAAAIRAYEKAGFEIVQVHPDVHEVWMIKEIKNLKVDFVSY